jgi:hypothetical protein
MSKGSTIKRQNFNVTVEEEAELNNLRETLCAPSVKDAIMRAARLVLTITNEVREGRSLYLADRKGLKTRVLLPEVERTGAERWIFLTSRPNSWKRQLFIKGRRQTAANIYYDMLANGDSVEAAAEDWSLPVEAIEEIVRYCEENRELIGMETDEEKRILLEAGVVLEPQANQ